MGSSFAFRIRGIAALSLASSVLLASMARADTPPLPSYPTIQSADANGTTLLTTGVNFGTVSRPVVKMGGTAPSVSDGFSATSIVATVPRA